MYQNLYIQRHNEHAMSLASPQQTSSPPQTWPASCAAWCRKALQPVDIREVYEVALLILEQQQGAVPDAEATFKAARSAIERNLA